jgi:hypothetical protein
MVQNWGEIGSKHPFLDSHFLLCSINSDKDNNFDFAAWVPQPPSRIVSQTTQRF